MSVTMYDEAVAWVERHRATCTDPRCGCAAADLDDLVAALCAEWLGLEQ